MTVATLPKTSSSGNRAKASRAFVIAAASITGLEDLSQTAATLRASRPQVDSVVQGLAFTNITLHAAYSPSARLRFSNISCRIAVFFDSGQCLKKVSIAGPVNTGRK